MGCASSLGPMIEQYGWPRGAAITCDVMGSGTHLADMTAPRFHADREREVLAAGRKVCQER
jgi:hypothetical protein